MKKSRGLLRRLADLSLRMKLLSLFTLISLMCVVTVSAITFIQSGKALEQQAASRLESMGQIMKQRVAEIIKRSTVYTERFSKNRLIEGLFLSYEGVFYGGGFAPGEDQTIDTNAYYNLSNIYGERLGKMVDDFNLGNILLVTVDSL